MLIIIIIIIIKQAGIGWTAHLGQGAAFFAPDADANSAFEDISG